MSPLEIGANGLATASILLAGRNSIHTWWTGIAGCLAFAGLFLGAKLYADVVLQAFFVVTSVLGWWRWRRAPQAPALDIGSATWRTLAAATLGGLVAAGVYGWILSTQTDAYAPFWDSVVLAFSVIAQCLLVRRLVQTWVFWLIVNAISVPLYASRDLHLTATLYAMYGANAVVSWRYWRTQLAARSAVSGDPR